MNNPKIPEGINVSKSSPIKEFFILTIGLLVGVFFIVFIIMQLATLWAPLIPFDYEQSWTDDLASQLIDAPNQTKEITIEQHLNKLAQSLLQEMAIKDDSITIQVHYIDDAVVNAFATLGGHIFIYKGLLEKIQSENALSLLLAHEIAHVVHRDPIVALTRQVGASIVLGLIASQTTLSSAIDSTSLLTAFSFTRKQETKADALALKAVYGRYGHVFGASHLFDILNQQQRSQYPEFLSTHPLTNNRSQRLKEIALKNQWPVSGALTRLKLTLP